MAEVKFVDRNFFQRLLGIPATPKPENPDAWNYLNGKLTIDLSKAPELNSVGGAFRAEGNGLPVRVLVVRGENDDYRAYQNRCTHLGHRRLDPVPGTNTVQCCSVNKSTYDEQGNKIYGPAPEPIKTYPVEKQDDKLVITVAE